LIIVVVAPAKKPWKGEKRHHAVCDTAAMNKIRKQLSICYNGYNWG
jgi:hypothetical protein